MTVTGHGRVCIGGPAASGECFVEDRMTRNLRVGDCVRVTYLPDESVAWSTATRLERLEAARDPADCPRR